MHVRTLVVIGLHERLAALWTGGRTGGRGIAALHFASTGAA
jgi:hypothetical protein